MENAKWRPNSDFFKLNRLERVLGVNFNPHCTSCHLVKRALIRGDKTIALYQQRCPMFFQYGYPQKWLWNEHAIYGETFRVVEAGFWPLCLCKNSCLVYEAYLPFTKAIFSVSLPAQNILYVTGPLAILVNAAVIVLVIFNKNLRKNTAVLLICNLAVCDVFVGIHSILFARYNFPRSRIDLYHKILEGLDYGSSSEYDLIFTWTYIMGPILTISVTSQVCISVILTVDKFLKICFATKPSMALTKRGIFALVILSWLFSLTFSILPVFNVGRMSYVDTYWVIPLPTDQALRSHNQFTVRIGIAAGTQIFLMAVQILSLLAYVPIFVVAKKSEGNFGIRNEARIAKKICPLVLSNVVFFTIPVSLAIFDDKINSNINYYEITLARAKAITFLLINMPVLCVNINSILNPFLYAMRHPMIKAKLQTQKARVGAWFSGHIIALGQRLNITSNAVRPGEEIEMWNAASVVTGTSRLDTN